MNHCYRDILDRISEPPLWFDEQAVPRYCTFSPEEISNIYARECVLMVIGCQNCRHEFQVAMSRHGITDHNPQSLEERVRNRTIHYGDPPNIECCGSGLSMNSVPLQVLEFWRMGDVTLDWEQAHDLEVDVHDPADWDPEWEYMPPNPPTALAVVPATHKVQRILDLDDED